MTHMTYRKDFFEKRIAEKMEVILGLFEMNVKAFVYSQLLINNDWEVVRIRSNVLLQSSMQVHRSISIAILIYLLFISNSTEWQLYKKCNSLHFELRIAAKKSIQTTNPMAQYDNIQYKLPYISPSFMNKLWDQICFVAKLYFYSQ